MAYPFAPRRQENKTGAIHRDENDAGNDNDRQNQTRSGIKLLLKSSVPKPAKRLTTQK